MVDEVAGSPAWGIREIFSEHHFGYFVFVPVVDCQQIEFLVTGEESRGNFRGQRTTGDTHTQAIVKCKQEPWRRGKSDHGQIAVPARFGIADRVPCSSLEVHLQSQ